MRKEIALKEPFTRTLQKTLNFENRHSPPLSIPTFSLSVHRDQISLTSPQGGLEMPNWYSRWTTARFLIVDADNVRNGLRGSKIHAARTGNDAIAYLNLVKHRFGTCEGATS
ncbi:hypothetical protein RchiOBHm_Chr4g0398721 [Rosa chinensis]|uniref:Uncharacterized protein n=1 Tax=Rosa chinensis TaxID=74649 RepID=A0A2P6QSD4_ROSCH|nr:uncharacterized protein LOC112200245 [Rosa chinensis]PRQ37088.1 hypothetical protein RchiOBHm_Chr4g0398721 [Rosa chinensis]